MTPRIFTVSEANALLPRMRDVLGDLQSIRAEIEKTGERLQILDALWSDAVRRPENPDHEEYLTHRRRIQGLVEKLEETVQDEILDRGVRFPVGALEEGLLDFPTSYEGRWVYLCWRMDEPEIRQWHEIHAGFRGRRDLTDEQARVMGIVDGPSDRPPGTPDA